MYIQSDTVGFTQHYEIAKRDGNPLNNTNTASDPSNQSGGQGWTYAVIGVIGGISVLIATALIYGRLRTLRVAGRSPKYIPTKFLKRRWEEWNPAGKYKNVSRDRSDSDTGAVNLTTTPAETRETTGVNRNTSVRSVMTLPPYSQNPKDTEEVIGREGERGGIDTVIELPETIQEEEERREQEMESLYQIRQARRREIEEREERRRERRQARERGDYARLEELRREARARREQNSLANLAHNDGSNVNLSAEMMMAEHNSRGRDRRVSEVSYAAVGQVRHDGSRIRSGSNDSERSGLLNGAAPMGVHTRNGSQSTLLSLGGLPQHRYRDRSNSAATSMSASSFENVTPPSDYTRPGTARTINSHLTTGSISDIGGEESDVANERIVISGTDSDDSPRPPDYEGHEWGNAPQYTESQVVTRANSNATTRTRTDNLSIITPSIHIQTPTGPNTPVVPETNQAGQP